MKFTSSHARVVLATLALSACGGKTDNPDAVTLENLKAASGLTITDKGNGAIVLSWAGSNFESKFAGYNIFGMKMTDAELTSLGLSKGKPLQLLDGAGAPIEGAKAVLTKFNYGASLEAAAEVGSDEKTSAGAEAKIAFLPIHSKDAKGEPVLPTCQPASTTCVATTESNKKSSDISNNGYVSYAISGLTAGSQYCFLVFSVLDEGKQIAQSSTNVECVVARPQLDVTLETVASNPGKVYDLRDYLSQCSGFTCPTLTATAASGSADANSTAPLYVETFSSTVYFTTGKNAAIQDLGYYADGFADATLPKVAPKIDFTFNGSSNVVANGGGYAIPGQSLIVKAKHMYVLAVADAGTTAPTDFRYHWIYISSTPSAGSAMNATIRLSNNVNQR